MNSKQLNILNDTSKSNFKQSSRIDKQSKQSYSRGLSIKTKKSLEEGQQSSPIKSQSKNTLAPMDAKIQHQMTIKELLVTTIKTTINKNKVQE